MALRPLEPKSSASASSATLAQAGLTALYRPSARQRAYAAARRSTSAAWGTPKRAVLRPHGHALVSTMDRVKCNPDPSMCNPLCASHSPANNCPEGPMICSKIGTRNARQNAFRSCSVNRGEPGRSRTTRAWVSDGIRTQPNTRIWSIVAAIAEGSKCAASSPHPCGKIRTFCAGNSAANLAKRSTAGIMSAGGRSAGGNIV